MQVAKMERNRREQEWFTRGGHRCQASVTPVRGQVSAALDSARCRAGGLPKRSNGADCKSAGSAFAGSNPAPPILNLERGVWNENYGIPDSAIRIQQAGVAQW